MPKKLRLGLLMILVGLGLFTHDVPASSESYPERICLGWRGGPGSNGYKWVFSNILWKGNHATITYDWAGFGTMVGDIHDGVLRGTWQQIGANGGFYFSLPVSGQKTAPGHWWNALTPQQTHELSVTTQLSRCS